MEIKMKSKKIAKEKKTTDDKYAVSSKQMKW